MRLSVLDQSPISAGSTGPQALANTLDLARLADELGYHRYWVAEHHGGPMLAGPSPEVLIGPIAAATERIRVGSGGVMLPHYSPLAVAESFSPLSGLFPGRIDLGVGRAAGTDPMTTYALQRDRRQASPDDFPEQLSELLAHLEDSLPADHPFARISRSLPGRPEAPEPWLLGSSRQSAIWAAQLGLPYAFADFINRDGARLPAPLRPGRAPARPADRGGDVGAGGGHRGGGVAADRVEPDGDDDAAPRPPDSGAAGRAGAAVPRGRGQAGRGQPADHRRHARPGPRGAGDAGAAVRRRRTDRRDDHVRPRRAAALLRADR